MTIILLAIIIGIILGIKTIPESPFTELFDYIFVPIIFGFLVGFLGFLVAIALPMDTYDANYSYSIESLQDNSSIKGQCYLGSGSIEGKMQYIFYYQSGEYYKMAQIEHDSAKIKYSNKKPIVHITENCPTDSWINYFAYDSDIHDKDYIIEVPKGTIKNNYNLNAK